MAEHWSFVVVAYGLTAAALIAYWRRLARRERQLDAARHPRP
jgi:hypothetical protein